MQVHELLSVFVAILTHIFYGIDVAVISSFIACTGNIRNKSLWLLVPYVIFSCLFCLENLPLGIRITLFTAMYVLLLLTAALICRHEKLKALYWSTMFITVDSLTSSLMALILTLFNVQDDDMLLPKLTSLIINIVFLITFMIRKRRYTANSEHIPSLPKGIAVSAFALLFLLSMLSAFVSVDFISRAVKRPTIIILVMLLIVVSCLTIIHLLAMFLSAMRYKHTSDQLFGEMIYLTEYFRHSGLMASDIRRFRHDYKNHLQCLNSLLKKNKTAEASEYLRAILGNSSVSAEPFNSGNELADDILNTKSIIASKNGCIMRCSGTISPDIPMLNLTTILFNALDNAIEGCCRYEGMADKTITVDCSVRNCVQFIKICNPCSNANVSETTSKADKNMHGFGMKNMRKAVKDLDGKLSAYIKNEQYILEVTFRLTNKIG